MSYSAFFREQAEQGIREAEAAALPNVRQRCLRSAATWAAMAERAEPVERISRDRAAAQVTLRDG
jgi:hypothetical protein